MVEPPAWDDRREAVARAAVFGIAGAAADVDLLFHAHSGATHGLGAAVIAGLAAWVVFGLLPAGAWRARLAVAVAAAYATHTLLDWLSTDTSPPVGIMALWPVSRGYYESSLHIFMAISRRYWLPEFWTANLRALARELAILVPVVAVVFWYRRRR
jgi:membrane-bound metal-dependent hydrolase YbcI (DUF457 family)